MLVAMAFFALAVGATVRAAPADDVPPRALPLPTRTAWKPAGCRSVPFSHPVMPARTAVRRAHGDLESSNEVDLAYAPVFSRERQVDGVKRLASTRTW